MDISTILTALQGWFGGLGIDTWWQAFWLPAYFVTQVSYFATFLVFYYFVSLPIDWVDPNEGRDMPEDELPFMVLAYPVLRENAETMRTTLTALAKTDYPASRYLNVALVNWDDHDTIKVLKALQADFTFEIIEVPATNHRGWHAVWRAWERNDKAYWYHRGRTIGSRALPPKKTRQLIYLVYRLAEKIGTDWILDYIDADSIPPPDHFRIAAGGLRHFDVLQSTNVAGNLMDSFPASLHAFDHMCWDGFLYPHMSAEGGHPYYVLGKGLFYRASDLLELGCFNPWVAIEDPEIGLRLWTNGKRLGIIAEPLVEEVPRSFFRGVVQRYRWVCGFFQTLGSPLKRMGMPFLRRMQARLNLIPVLSLPVNLVGLPVGVNAAYLYFQGVSPLPAWAVFLSFVNIGLYLLTMLLLYRNSWYRSGLVVQGRLRRVWYLLRVNPISLFVYHTVWTLPIIIGFFLFVTDRGKTWARTTKYDAIRVFAGREEG